MKKLKILFVAAELTPLAKVGGLGDVIGSLPKALKKLEADPVRNIGDGRNLSFSKDDLNKYRNHSHATNISNGVDVRIVIPKYGIIDPKKYPMKRIAKKIKVPFEGKEELIDIYSTFLPGSKIPVYLVDHPKYLGQNGVYYNVDASSSGTITEAHRFIFFIRAVLEIFKPLRWQPDILSCHDWQTGLLILLGKIWNLPYKTLFTIHNLAYQGHYNAEAVLKMLNLKEEDWPTLKIKDKEGNLVSLQQGILNADLINTVSPTYAKEILTKEYGCGLEKTLRKRKKDLYGILNGIDLDCWNPATDPEIKVNYELEIMNGVSPVADPTLFPKVWGKRRVAKAKEENKRYLQKICRLPINSKIPIIGIISRLADQKGFGLIDKAFDEIMKLNLQFVLLGTGDSRMEKIFREKAKEYPKKFSCHLKFDAKLAQQIYAGSDMFLMPSRYEPCGLGQMISMRYGTIPIVRKTGGLADTIQNYEPRKIRKMQKDNKATGFVFERYEATEMLEAIKKALKVYKNKKIWLQLIIDAMEQDFSWTTSAKEYLKLYRKLAF